MNSYTTRVLQVGYDLVDVQIPLRVLPPSISRRIKWVYGNLYVMTFYIPRSRSSRVPYNSLTQRLPFRSNEFDFIHLEGIALAVPEDKVRVSLLGDEPS